MGGPGEQLRRSSRVKTWRLLRSRWKGVSSKIDALTPKKAPRDRQKRDCVITWTVTRRTSKAEVARNAALVA